MPNTFETKSTTSSALFRLVLSLLLVGIVACKGKARRTPDDTAVLLVDRPIVDLDPRFPQSSYDIKISRVVAPGLTALDRSSMEPRLALASAIEQTSPTTWVATLRQGIRFSDGSELTADDVVYTFQSVLDPKLSSFVQTMYRERLRDITAVDRYTVRFELVKPFATFMTDLDIGIISKAAMTKLPGERRADGAIMGTGAYQVSKRTDTEVVLTRNPYHEPPAKLPKVVIRTVRDPNARMLLLVGGSADLMLNGLTPTMAQVVQDNPRLEVEKGPSAILTYLMFHTEKPPLQKREVRQAIALAIDRQLLIRNKLQGYAVPATGLLPPGHWAYDSDVPRYPFDPKRARQLLDEAGYPDPPGDAPRFSLIFKTSADPYRLTMSRLIAQQLQDVGIAIEVRSFEFQTFFSDVKAGNFELGFMQTSSIIEPDNYTRYFHSQKIPTPEDPNLGNRWRYKNTELDDILEKARHTTSGAERVRLYSKVQNILATDLPIVPLWHEDNLLVRNQLLDGFEILPNAGFYSLAVVDKSAQKNR